MSFSTNNRKAELTFAEFLSVGPETNQSDLDVATHFRIDPHQHH